MPPRRASPPGSITWILAAVVATALGALTLAACGGDSRGHEGDPTETATGASESTPSPTPATAEPTRSSPTATPEPAETSTPAPATAEPTRSSPTATPEPAETSTPAPATAEPTKSPATATPSPEATPAPAATEAAEAATPAREAESEEEAAEEEAAEEEAAAEMETGDDDAEVAYGRGGDGHEAGGAIAVDSDTADEMAYDVMADDAADMDSAEDAMEEEPSSSSGYGDEMERPQPALSAGEVNDNERWDEYLRYRAQYNGPDVHNVDVSERYIITVSDSSGRPVPDARVRVSSGDTALFEGRTYANGQTLFFPRAFAAGEGAEAFTLSVEKNGASKRLEFARGASHDWNVTLELEQGAVEGVPLDILFLLDSTGSMADEIAQIKETLLSVAARISDLPSQPDLRFGMVAYRDRGDEFVTRVYGFEPDAGRFAETIQGVVADGGDDYPESLNEALHVAVHEPRWRLGEAIRLMFLIADAPPHLDYEDDYSYADDMVEAHRRGIKTFAIASSGLDPQGEYIFRQIAQHTMGRFIFIVYGAGGTTTHNVSDYTVERLDDLVVSLVEQELTFLSR